MAKFSKKSLKQMIQKTINKYRVIERGELFKKFNKETENTGKEEIFNKALFNLQEEGKIKIIEPKIGDDKSDIVVMKNVQKADLTRFFSTNKKSDRRG